MKYPPSILDEIKARLPASAVVGRRVQLKKAGREWRGLSPFGKEKTPSFFVNDTKQAWFDFSSGRNGDIFKFVMETEGLSFPEAVERLAAEAGVELPRFTEEAQAQEERAKGLHEVMELAASFFEAELRAERGAGARRYLQGRGLFGPPANEFRLGYSPNERFALRDHLAGKGVDAAAMMEAGLLVHGDEIPVPYDRFRDRVMFPIADARGRVVAFGGRAMEKDVPAKYLNSPETPLFHKGRQLYNHHRARKAAHDAGTLVAVEGYVDVIAMHMSGFANTVAPLGTALTEDQMQLMWRMADEPILCFDGDKAGRKAAYRAIDVALPLLPPGKSVRFALLPEGQDPDDLARSGGREAIAGVLEQARPLIDMVWAREMEAGPTDTPERRASMERRLKEALQRIPDESTRRYYRDEIENRLATAFPAAPRRQRNSGQNYQGEPYQKGRSPGFGRVEGGRFGAKTVESLRASPALARSRLYLAASKAESPREAFIIAGLAYRHELLEHFADEIAELDLSGPAALKLAQALIDMIAGGEVQPDQVATRLATPGLRASLAHLDQVIAPADRKKLEPEVDSLTLADAIRQAIVLHRRARTLHSELKAAERALADDMTDANFVWVKDVKARLESVEGTQADRDLPE